MPINPFEDIKKDTINFLDVWKHKGVFNSDPSFNNINLYVKNTSLPRGCALIKVHKNDFPVRLIIPYINSPIYAFDKCLSKIFTSHFSKPKPCIKNCLEIKNILKNTLIPDNYKLIS